jgi:ActR/RegA family two-component response regulator
LLPRDHALVTLAGPAAAAALVRLYGGERIVVPLGAAWRRARVARRARELRAAGLNNCEIARRLGLHLRQVQRLVRNVDVPGMAEDEA